MSEQQQFIERLRAVFADDDRVRSIHLTGSFGAGEQDEWSDVDTVFGVAPDALGEVFESWPEIASAMGEVLHLQNLPGTPVISHVFEPWLRWDVTLLPADQVAGIPGNLARVLLDKDELGVGPDLPPGEADPAHIEGLTREFVRIMGLLPVVVGRQDIVTGVAGANLARQLVLALFTALADGNNPGGALRARRVLPAEDYDRLLTLPVLEPRIESIVAVHQACWGIFLPRAQAFLGEQFPQQMVEACSRRLSSALG